MFQPLCLCESMKTQLFEIDPDQLFVAADRVARSDRRVSTVRSDGQQRTLEFRVQVDRARPAEIASERFWGIYVQATIAPTGANKATLILELKRIYPVAGSPERSSARAPEADEAAFARGFLHKVKAELKRTQSLQKRSACSTRTAPAPANTCAR